jgi:geranylgeranyl diphosphate synthase type II
MFQVHFKTQLELIDTHLRSVLRDQTPSPLSELQRFWESMAYSLHGEGKRFRPLLAVLTAESIGHAPEIALPLATAVEMVHTYSLIHDDLPCMDNDDFRRGRPTNHRVYGEAGALLAGDALLTMSFGVLAQTPSASAATAVALLSEAAGPRGMVGGQVLDVQADRPNLDLLKEIHKRKTGALIRVSVEASALLCQASSQQQQHLRAYGEHLGFAFQLADDVQDYDPAKPEKISFASTLGMASTLQMLEEESERALKALESFSDQADGLRRMIELNRERV